MNLCDNLYSSWHLLQKRNNHSYIHCDSYPQLISEFPSFQKIAITVIVSTVALFTNFSAATATRELLEIYND